MFHKWNGQFSPNEKQNHTNYIATRRKICTILKGDFCMHGGPHNNTQWYKATTTIKQPFLLMCSWIVWSPHYQATESSYTLKAVHTSHNCYVKYWLLCSRSAWIWEVALKISFCEKKNSFNDMWKIRVYGLHTLHNKLPETKPKIEWKLFILLQIRRRSNRLFWKNSQCFALARWNIKC